MLFMGQSSFLIMVKSPEVLMMGTLWAQSQWIPHPELPSQDPPGWNSLVQRSPVTRKTHCTVLEKWRKNGRKATKRTKLGDPPILVDSWHRSWTSQRNASKYRNDSARHVSWCEKCRSAKRIKGSKRWCTSCPQRIQMNTVGEPWRFIHLHTP